MSNLNKTFLKPDKSDWSYKIYEVTEIIFDTILNYKIDDLSERYKEVLLKKTKSTMEENKNVMKNLNLN